MAVVNRIDIHERKGIIKTCQDFADVFSKIILKESQGFPEVRVLFERYDELSQNPKLVKIVPPEYRFSTRWRTIPMSKTLRQKSFYLILIQKEILQNV